jgi:hypothetical protein
MWTFILPSLCPGAWETFFSIRMCLVNALLALLGREGTAYTSDTIETQMRRRKILTLDGGGIRGIVELWSCMLFKTLWGSTIFQ